MAVNFDRKMDNWGSVDELKNYLKSNGHTTKALLDDKTMEKAVSLVRTQKNYI